MTHTGHILLETYVIEYGRSPAIIIFCLEPTFDLNLGRVSSNSCFRFFFVENVEIPKWVMRFDLEIEIISEQEMPNIEF